MDSARQFVRDTIPGAFFLVWVLCAYVLVQVLSGKELAAAIGPVTSNLSFALPSAGVVLICSGWSSDRIYEKLYRPLMFGGRIARRDRGWEILECLAPWQLDLVRRLYAKDLVINAEAPYTAEARFGWRRPDPELATAGKTPYRVVRLPILLQLRVLTVAPGQRKGYERMWEVHRSVIQSLLNLVVEHGGAAIKSDFVQVSDRYESLGAARVAMWCGTATGFTLAVVQLAPKWPSLTALVVASAGLLGANLIWAFGVLHGARRKAWSESVDSLGRDFFTFFTDHADLLRRLVETHEAGASLSLDESTRLRSAGSALPRVADIENPV